MDIVSQVLEKAAKEAEKFKPIHVDKHLELEYDLGTLLTIDTNDLNSKKLRFVFCHRLEFPRLLCSVIHY